jgi:hypothetical protein
MWQHAAEHLEHVLSRQQGIDYSLESSSNAGGRHFRLLLGTVSKVGARPSK